jgi:hypothetical protein
MVIVAERLLRHPVTVEDAGSRPVGHPKFIATCLTVWTSNRKRRPGLVSHSAEEPRRASPRMSTCRSSGRRHRRWSPESSAARSASPSGSARWSNWQLTALSRRRSRFKSGTGHARHAIPRCSPASVAVFGRQGRHPLKRALGSKVLDAKVCRCRTCSTPSPSASGCWELSRAARQDAHHAPLV